MTDIFAGTLSLADPAAEPAATAWDLAGPREILHDVRQAKKAIEQDVYQPLPESMLNDAAQRVREDARKLGLDYDAEVMRTLNRMKNPRATQTPGPQNMKAGADPMKDVSYWDLLQAQTVVAEQFRRFYGIT